MDPTETLRLISAALAEEDTDSAAEHAGVLHNWLARCGFPPNWGSYPKASEFFRAWLAED